MNISFKAQILLGLFIAGISSIGQSAIREFSNGQWKMDSRMRFFSSDSNYDSSGNQVTLPYGSGYQLLTVDFASRYVVSSVWSLNGGLQLASGMSNGFDARRTNTSMPNMFLGTEWVAYVGGIDVIPEVQAIIPIEKISDAQDVAFNGEGSTQILAAANVQKEFDGFGLFGGVGYLMRDSRSSQLPWKIGAQFNFSSVNLSAELRGAQTVGSDKDKGTLAGTSRNQTIQRVNAGSYKFYSIDPSLTEIGAELSWNASRSFTVGFEGAFTLAGTNSAAGWSIGANLGWMFNPGSVRKKSIQIKKQKPQAIDPFLDNFHEDTSDGVDQSLFQPLSKPALPSEESETYVPTPVRPDGDESGLNQKQLDNYEMQIELKSKKKKRRK